MTQNQILNEKTWQEKKKKIATSKNILTKTTKFLKTIEHKKSCYESKQETFRIMSSLNRFSSSKMYMWSAEAWAPVAQWIERLFPKQKVTGSTPVWRVYRQN